MVMLLTMSYQETLPQIWKHRHKIRTSFVSPSNHMISGKAYCNHIQARNSIWKRYSSESFVDCKHDLACSFNGSLLPVSLNDSRIHSMTLFGRESISKCSANRNWVIASALGGRLRHLVGQPQAAVTCLKPGRRSQPQPTCRTHMSSVSTTQGRKETIPAGLARSSDLRNWEQISGYRFKPLKISWLLCLSVNHDKDMGWWARLSSVKEDEAWRKLSGQK